MKEVWFGLVNESDLKRPLVPLKVAKTSLKQHLETILGRVGPGRVGLGRSNSDNKADSVQLCWGWDWAWQKINNIICKLYSNCYNLMHTLKCCPAPHILGEGLGRTLRFCHYLFMLLAWNKEMTEIRRSVIYRYNITIWFQIILENGVYFCINE